MIAERSSVKIESYKSKTIQSLQVRQLYAVVNTPLVVSASLAALFAYIMYGKSSSVHLFIWLSLVVLVSFSRFILSFEFKRINRKVQLFPLTWLTRFRFGVVSSGILWGVASLLVDPVNQSQQFLFLIFLLSGLTAASVISYSADIFSTISYSCLIILPLGVRLLITGDSQSVAMSIALIIYLCFIAIYTRINCRQIVENIILRLDAVEREERYRSLLAYSPAGIFDYDRNLVITFCNDRLADMLNSTPANVVGLDMKRLNDQAIIATLRKTLAGEIGEYEGHYFATFSEANGLISMNCAPIRDINRDVVSGVAIIQDITERKKAEQALKQSKDQLAAVLNATSESIFHVDINGTILAINNIAALRVKKEPQDMIGKCAFDFFPPEVAVSRRDNLGEVFGTGKEKYSEDCRNGHFFSLNYYPIFDSAGKVQSVVVYAADITEKRINQSRLEQLLAEQKALLENDLIGIVTVKDRKIIWANPAYEKMLGYGPGECIGTRTIKYYSSEEAYRALGVAAYPELLAGKVYRTQIEHLRKDGKHIWVELSGSMLNRETGESLWGFVDITELKQVENDLRQSHQQIHSLLNSMAEGAYGVDINGNCTFVNRSFLRILGYEHDGQIIGKHIHTLIHHSLPDGRPYPAAECKMYKAYRQNQEIHVSDEVFWTQDGKAIPVEYWSQPIVVDNVMQGAIATFMDVTERKKMEETLRESELRYRTVADYTSDWEYWVLPNRTFRYVSPSSEQVCGYSPDEFYADPQLLPHIIHPDDLHLYNGHVHSITSQGFAEPIDFRIRTKSGETRWISHVCRPVYDSSGLHIGQRASNRDITERKAAEELIRNLAFYDALTHLPNRRLLNDRMKYAMYVSKRSGRYCALMFLDLDNFKPLNDAHGHGVGDLLLIEVARRITGCVREVDTVARFGGDEFVVMLSELEVDKAESIAQAGIIAEKIRASLAEPYLLKIQNEVNAEISVEHHCTSSIGVVLFIDHEACQEDIFKWADMAMYQAKSDGRNLIRFCDSQCKTEDNSNGRDSKIIRLIWHESYNCGEPTIDQEHEKLFELANTLIASAFTRSENPQQFDHNLEKLLAHVVQHFADEEAILARHHYADLDNHALAHKVLVEHALQLRNAILAGGGTIGELVSFIASEVVAQHMLAVDRQFYSLFKVSPPDSDKHDIC